MSIGGWIRSPQSLALLWTALAMSLALGTTFVVVNDPVAEMPHGYTEPLSDDQAAAQVVNAAREIVTVGHLQQTTAGYAFVSCKNVNEPPYQAALYMSFRLPHNDWVRYLNGVASAMTEHGWTDSPAMGEHFGEKLTKAGVTSVFYRNATDTEFATMRLYGECRITGDHRDDNPAWTEVGL